MASKSILVYFTLAIVGVRTVTCINCTINDLIDSCVPLNRTCNGESGECECPTGQPVQLSPQIPCLRYRNLGEVCLHNRQCSQVKNAVCVATFLFPVEINSIPTYKQWFFYNQINDDEDDDVNFLLNKMYGRCRCKTGFRTVPGRQCVYTGRNTRVACNQTNDCRTLVPGSLCDHKSGFCRCRSGRYLDQGQCQPVANLHGQYCLANSDCLQSNSSMDCINSRCVCSTGYYFRNETGCVQNKRCSPGHMWNNTHLICQPLAIGTCTMCPLIIKLVLIILIKLAFFNIVRHLCLERSRRARTSGHQSRRYRHADPSRRSNCQSNSLLSLPDYETILSDQNCVACQMDRLPTYEEAVGKGKS